ncbi:MAG: 50S ribosomal protein L11 methyltransferase [Bacteroidota bacterium]
MPDTLRLTLPAPEPSQELLIADLADLGFGAFEADSSVLVAYMPAPSWTPDIERAARTSVRQRGIDPGGIRVETVPDRDWNAEWEATLQPIEVGPFVIAPSWTEVPPDLANRRILHIDPKMAFGTGHHETTRVCLRLLADVVPAGGRVLDVGTGTGVLALAALMLGADRAVGVDIDPWSVANGEENAARNGLADRFEVREGSLDVVPETGFDLVICNVIRSIMEPMLAGIIARAASGAPVVLSGLLTSERRAVTERLAASGRRLLKESSEGDWWGGVWQ